MEIRRSKRFDSAYRKLPADIQDKANKQLVQFIENPNHPSLRLKKMKWRENRWEIRITRSHRIVFLMKVGVCILTDIGAHDILDKQ